MEEQSIFEQPRQPFNMQQQLQNATAVLVLGILSIVICGIGVVLAIIALVLANKDLKLYNASPEIYNTGSYNNLKAGRICAIVGLILNIVGIIGYAIFIIFILTATGGAWH